MHKTGRMIKKNILLLLIFITSLAYSQQIKITGKVTNQQGKSLEHVSVSEMNSRNGVITNERGEYALSIQPKDSIKIIFSLIGYQRHQYIIPKSKSDLILNITLKEDNNTLEAITIEGQQTVTTVIERIDYLATRRASNPWGSIESLLATMGG